MKVDQDVPYAARILIRHREQAYSEYKKACQVYAGSKGCKRGTENNMPAKYKADKEFIKTTINQKIKELDDAIQLIINAHKLEEAYGSHVEQAYEGRFEPKPILRPVVNQREDIFSVGKHSVGSEAS